MLKAGTSEDKRPFWVTASFFLIVYMVAVVGPEVCAQSEDGRDTGDVGPVVAFDVSSGRGMEGILPVEIAVSLSAASQQTVTVDYKVTSGTAMRAEDFALPAGTLTFSPGQMRKHITLSIVQDDVDEPNET
ncbi:MAG: Calx-beta domain-containing protein, partial [Planctomycetota bacterium]